MSKYQSELLRAFNCIKMSVVADCCGYEYYEFVRAVRSKKGVDIELYNNILYQLRVSFGIVLLGWNDE